MSKTNNYEPDASMRREPRASTREVRSGSSKTSPPTDSRETSFSLTAADEILLSHSPSVDTVANRSRRNTKYAPGGLDSMSDASQPSLPEEGASDRSTIPSQPHTILESRPCEICPGRIQLLVKWYGLEEPTWEFEDDLGPEFASSNPGLPTELGEEELAILSQDLDIIQTLSQMEQAEPTDDDPHTDWQGEEESHLEELDIEDEDHEPQDFGPDVGETELYPQAESDGQYDLSTFSLSQRYYKYLTTLCSATRIFSAERPTLEALLDALQLINNQTISQDLQADTESIYAYGLVTASWLVICHRMCVNRRPVFDRPSSTCQSLYLVAAKLIPYTVPKALFQNAVQYWETRLHPNYIWLSHKWYDKAPKSIRESDLPPLDPVAKEYLRLLDNFGVVGLASEVVAKEFDGYKSGLSPIGKYMASDPDRREWAMREVSKIFASIDESLLESMIRRRLSQDAMHENAVRTVLVNNRYNMEKHPAIYANFLVDRSGMSPTPDQWRTVVRLVKTYLQEDIQAHASACEIDQAIFPLASWPGHLAFRGLRRYTDFSTDKMARSSKPNEARRGAVKFFLEQMETRINDEVKEGREDTPFASAVIEIGYALHVHDRMKHHRRHVNSNYIMNLMQAAFKVAFPGSFVLQQEVIYKCWRHPQPWLSEIILTQLCQGYTKNASGFSHYIAGRSNVSSWKQNNMGDWTEYEKRVSLGKVEKVLDKSLALINPRLQELQAEVGGMKQELERKKSLLAIKAKQCDSKLAMLRTLQLIAEAIIELQRLALVDEDE